MHNLKTLLKTKPPLIWPQPSSKRATEIKRTVLELQAAPLPRLRKTWKDRYGEPVPAPSSRTLLFRLLAWRIQADAFGGLKPETLKFLNTPISRRSKSESKAATGSSLSIGTLLKRDWHGRMHHVVVTKDGFGHEGKTYKSLSEAARAITGTKWSGPRFFGFEKGKTRKAGASK